MTSRGARTLDDTYRDVVESQAELICRFELTGRLTFVNEAYARYFDRTVEELVGKTFLPLIPDEDHAQIGRMLSTLSVEHPAVATEHRVIMPDGDVRWLAWNNRAFFDASGELSYIQAVGRDVTARRLSMQHLSRSEARLRLLVSAFPDLAIVVNREGRCLDVLTQREDLLYEPREDILGRTFPDILPGEVARRLLEVIGQTLDTGESQMAEYPLEVPAGRRWFSARTSLFSDPTSAEPLVLFHARDITTRKEAQRALEESQARYRMLYENIPTMYFTLDTEGKVLDVNRYGVEHLGYPKEELVGETVLNVFHPDDREAVKVSLATQFKKPGTVVNVQFRKLKKDGTVIWVDEAVRLFENPDGEQVILVACEDVTERKQAELELRASEARFRRLFDSSIFGAFIGDLQGHVTEANDRLLEMLGYTRQDLPLRWDKLTPPAWTPMDIEKLREIRSTGVASPWNKEYYRADGTTVPVFVGAAMIPGPGEQCVAMVLDITEEKKAEKERERFSTLLIETQEAERQTISAALHDQLGQVLTLARLNIASITGGEADPEHAAKALVQIDEALRSVRAMAVSLRPPYLEDLGLVPAMEMMLDTMMEGLPIHASFEHAGAFDDLTPDQETCLYRVLQEALTNIVRYAEASEVKIVLSAHDTEVALTVSDDGRGFDTAGEKQPGFGLMGMRQRLARLGGTLSIASSPESGTTLHATMPNPCEGGGAPVPGAQ